jgi:hypothetical protein
VEYTLPTVPMLSVGGEVQYGFTPIAGGLGTTSQMAGLLSAAWRFPIVGRLSARVFAGGGYSAGLIHGDSLSKIGGGPLVEAGTGLSFAASPVTAARLDASYSYLFGANGSLMVSIGLSLRPRLCATVPAAARGWSSMEIGKVDLRSVYPALRRSSINHPAGTITMRNTGRGSITDVHVALRVAGFMEGRRESAVRRELRAGDTWEAPLVVVLGPGAVRGTTESAHAEVIVTWVEQGEPREARESAELRILEPHLVAADDLGKAAAFVLPFDPSVREIDAVISGARAAAAAESGVAPSLSAAIATREVIRLLDIRVTAGSEATPAENGEGVAVRHLKYPAETLRDRSGTDADVAVLCASLLEAEGAKASLVQADGRMFVAVDRDDAAEAADSQPAGPVEPILLGGRAWVPFETDKPDASFRDAAAAAVTAWKAAQAAGAGSLAPVREAWKLYPPSQFPQEAPKAPDLPGRRLEDAVRTAIAGFLGKGGPASSQADAATAVDSPARRLLVVFQPHPAGAYSEVRRASLADSLALALRRAVPGVMVIPCGDADFPGSTDKRIEAAREWGADCYVVVELSGEKQSAVITTESFDMLSRSSAIAPATLAGGPMAGDSEPDWGPVITLVEGAFGKAAPAAGR